MANDLADASFFARSFRDLAETKAPSVTYSIEMADQRSRFIETMLRRAPATLREQEEWEQSEANKVEIARLDRDAERAKQAEVERVKREETRRQAEELATARRQMVEDARTWYVKPVAVSDDDEDKPKRGKGRKKKEMDGIVPDGDGEEVVKQPKKRKKADGAAAGGKRKKKAKGENGQAAVGGDDNAEAGSAEASGAEKDDEDEGPKRAGGRRKKAFVSINAICGRCFVLTLTNSARKSLSATRKTATSPITTEIKLVCIASLNVILTARRDAILCHVSLAVPAQDSRARSRI